MELKFERAVFNGIRAALLLIEPYGIEMTYAEPYVGWKTILLIEPYGIEISVCVLVVPFMPPFNRTLWN